MVTTELLPSSMAGLMPIGKQMVATVTAPTIGGHIPSLTFCIMLLGYCEANYDSTVIFYKGHSWQTILMKLTSGFMTVRATGIDGYNVTKNEYIKDYNLYGNVSLGMAAAGKVNGTHNLVFLWTCGAGGDNRTGTNSGGDPWGMLSCWMNVDANSTMGRDGYASNETNNSGRCFIGFDYLSTWFHQGTGYNESNYGQFAYWFFYYALRDNNTVRDALDKATIATRGVQHLSEWTMLAPDVGHFYNPPGYDIWDPHHSRVEKSRIRIWGDGDTIIPHN